MKTSAAAPVPENDADAAPELSYRRRLWLLFSGFFKIAALVVGGGYAILPVAEAEFVHRRKMLSEVELVDMMAVIQSLPGIIAGNAALYIGFRAGGIPGALAALLGVATPSVLIIVAAALFLQSADLAHPAVQGAFLGAQAAITGLIAVTACRMARKTVRNVFALVLAAASVIAAVFFRVPPAWIIPAGAVSGGLWKLGISFSSRRKPDAAPGGPAA